MGKKGNWLSTLKKVFTPNSKEKLVNESEKKGVKEKKKWGVGKSRHGENNTFTPLYRGPSSIEKILGDAEREHQTLHSLPSRELQIVHSMPSREQKKTQEFLLAETNLFPSRDHQRTDELPPLKAERQQVNPFQPSVVHHRAAATYLHPITRNYHHIAAIRIQTAFRGYMARTNFRALKGLMRLQGVVRGHNVKRQTLNAMRCMQLLAKIQAHIQSRRIQMMESHAHQLNNLPKNNKEEEEEEISLGKPISTPQYEREYREEWDDSMLPKEEIDARMQKKVEAFMKRERGLAYAYPQLWKSSPGPAENALMEMHSGGFPWWWNWLDRRIPFQAPEGALLLAMNDATPRKSTQAKFGFENVDMATPQSLNVSPYTKSRYSDVMNVSPRMSIQAKFGVSNMDFATPSSSNVSPITKTKHYNPMNDATPRRSMNMDIATSRSANVSPLIRTKNSPLSATRTPQTERSTPSRSIKPKVHGNDFTFDVPMKDDDSLTSCPSFMVPNYMTPTVSAKAKVRAQSNPKERPTVAASGGGSKKRLSFHLPQSIGSLRWTKGSLFSGKASSAHYMSGNLQPMHSIGNLSVDSTLSLPAEVGRQTFK